VQKTDVRVITATNIKLRTAMERGKFREDLYYRLNAVQIMVPALRERKDDIYLLFRKFSSDFAEKYKLRKISLAIEAISLLKAYRWPGNVRQLKNVAETVTALESSQSLPGASDRIELSAAKLAPYIPNEHDELLPMPAPATGGGAPFGEDEKRVFIKALVDLKQEVDILKAKVDTLSSPTSAPQIPQNAPVQRDDAEWQEQKAPENISIKKANDVLIQRALEKHGGNIKEAAEELGISERTIYRRLAQKKKSK
jgi:DNA-binding NtrC family response regulator